MLRTRKGTAVPLSQAQVRFEPRHTWLTVVTRFARKQPLGVIGDEREPVHLAAEADVAGRRAEVEVDGAERLDAVGVGAPVVVVGAGADPLLPDPVEVDVGHGAGRLSREALAFGEQVARLVDHRLAVPGQVGRRLALAGRGEDVGRAAA